MTKFIGGMNVPMRFVRGNASRPLAELVLESDAITLRPRGIAAWVLHDFVIPVSQVAVVFPLSGGWLSRGVGISTTDSQVAYFWTKAPDDVLAALRAQGLTVDPSPRRPSFLWLRGRRNG
jgi:hypothetical protein